MKKTISFFLLLLCLVVVKETYAYSPKSLPISQNSDQWHVNIDEVKKTSEKLLQPKKRCISNISFLCKKSREK